MTLLAALKRVNANPPPEDSIGLRTAVLIAVVAAALGVLRLGIGGPLLGGAVLFGIPLASTYSYRARHRPGYGRKVLLAIAAVVALGRFIATASGLIGAGISALQVPLAELFLWVQVLHSLDLPSRRDLLFSLLSSLALVILGAALSTSMAYGLHLGIWAIAALASLVLAHRRQLAELPELQPDRTVDRRRSVRRIWRPVLLVIGLAVATFLVVPPTGSSRVLALPTRIAEVIPVANPGGLANPTLGVADPGATGPLTQTPRASFGYFGFARSLDTAARGRPDDTLVMRVRASRPDFWRGQTFDVWDGRRWTISTERSTLVQGNGPLELPPPEEDRFVQYLGEPFVQTYYVERPGPNVIFGAYKADLLYLPVSSAFALSDGTIRTAVELGEGTVYAVVSRRPKVTAEGLRKAPEKESRLPSSFLARYTDTASVTPRVRSLAEEITADAPTVYDKVLALEAWMADNTEYTLDAPPLPLGADTVEQFLFVDQKGFCEQIGTSLVVMLRSLGIPARLAVGYTPGRRNSVTGLYEVRASDAHAWAEVYFPKYGWQGFDPTTDVPLSGEAEIPTAGAALASYLSGRLPALVSGAPWIASVLAAGFTAAGVRHWRRGRNERHRGAVGLSWADASCRRLEAAGSRLGSPRSGHETTREYAQRLDRSVLGHHRLDALVVILEAATFSGVPLGEGRRSEAEAILHAISDRAAPS